MWYDALYHNDPSTDNIFGREDLGGRRNTALLMHLHQGGSLADFARLAPGKPGSCRLAELLDRALASARTARG